MSFCPKCKAEYINGRADCADCGVALVESLEDINTDIAANTGEFKDMYEEEVDLDTVESDEAIDKIEPAPKKERLYAFVSKEDKYKDYVSTGYTFLVIGIIGIIVITLNLLGIINIIHTSGVSAILFYFVIYGTLAIFTGVGIHSFITSNRMKADIALEAEFLNSINSYIKENINNSIFTDDFTLLSEEEIYFIKTEKIKELLYEQFPDISPSLMEELVDSTYDNLTN